MSIAGRLRSLVWLLSASFLVSCAAGAVITARLLTAEARLEHLSVALRLHVEGDMIHDEVIGHVYASLYAADRREPDLLRDQQSDLATDAVRMRGLQDQLAGLDLPSDSAAAVGSVRRPLDDYVEAARTVAALASQEPAAARQRLPALQRRFSDLEVRLAHVSDRMQAMIRAERATLVQWQSWWIALLIIGSLAGTAALAGVHRFLAGRVSGPLQSLVATLAALTAGDRAAPVAHLDRDDEIGDLARGLASFRVAVDEARREQAERVDAEERLVAERERQAEERERRRAETEAARRAELAAMACALEERVLNTAEQLRGAASRLQRASRRMKDSVVETRGDIVGAEGATAETASNITVAGSAAEEMSRAIAEISVRTGNSADAARDMSDRAVAAGGEMRGLEDAMARIGAISALISAVAQRTNLLALNATIEAARAGKAGNGFAVVAAEIKGLAARTTEATRDIGAHLDEVRRSALSVGGALDGVGRAVSEVETAATSIAASVRQQSLATENISDSIQRTIATTQGLLTSMGGLKRRAEDSNDVAESIAEAAGQLEADAEALSGEIVRLIGQIRTG